MELFKLFGTILVDNEKANQSIHATEKRASGLGQKMLKGVGTAAKWGAAVGSGAAAGGAAMFGLAKKAGDTADALLDLNSITGMSTDEIQKWQRAAKVAGVNSDAMTNASQKLTKTMDMMQMGSGKAAESATKLGLSYETLNKMSADERMNAVTKALSRVGDKTERARIGTDLLGGSWKEIAPIVDLGAKAMQEARDSANIISNEDLNQANNFRASVDTLKDSFGVLVTKIGIAAIPTMQKLADWIVEHMPQIEQVMTTVFRAIEAAVRAVGDVVRWLTDTFGSGFARIQEHAEGFRVYFEAYVEFTKDVFGGIKDIVDEALAFMAEIWEMYGEEISAVVGAIFRGIKGTIEIVMSAIKNTIKLFLALIKGDWEGVWAAISQFFSDTWNALKDMLPAFIDGMIAVFKGSVKMFFNVGAAIFQGLWDGMKSIWDGIVGFVKDAASWIADKLMFWRDSKNEMDKDSVNPPPVNGSHANGLGYVPFDGYIAELHRGERVLTAEENKNYAKPSGDMINNITINSNRPLSPWEIAKENKKALRNLALGV